MKVRDHFRLLTFVSIAWLLFWIGGLPDYYQQYSTTFMILFDLAILPPIWFIVYRSIKKAHSNQSLTISLWWAFYISIPLFVYDLIYVGIYLGHGMTFLWSYWYITAYYLLPWLLFPLTGWLIEKKARYRINEKVPR